MVPSTDGVRIACWLSGTGPFLVLVHGASADHTRWLGVLPRLKERFTVCVVDRRGRGESEDAPVYSLDSEFDDIASVCDSLNGPVHVLGHSYGGLCVLGAAERAQNIAGMILYEPSIGLDEPPIAPEHVLRMERMLEQGDRERMLIYLFREVVQVSPEEVETLRADPSWKGRLESAHTIPRELAVELPNASAFRNITVPTLILTGEVSPPVEIAAADAVHAALPNSRKVVMPGQGHVAMTTAPELFVEEVTKFMQR